MKLPEVPGNRGHTGKLKPQREISLRKTSNLITYGNPIRTLFEYDIAASDSRL